MKRRSFLKNTTAFTLPAFFGGMNIAAMPSKIMEGMVNGDSDRVLVLIDLNGGNDALNTFIPLDGYDNLANVRSNVIIPQSNILPMTDSIGLHPELSGVRNLYDNANLTVVQGVGYPDQNRSHFRSADIWNTGVRSNESKSTGWLGRYLDDTFPGYPENYPNADCPDPFAVTMGHSISGTCQGMDSNFSMAILNTDNIGGLSTGIEVPFPNDCYGEELAFIVDTYKKSNVYADRVIEAIDLGNSNESLYPDTLLSEQMKIVAKLISGGLRTKVFVLKLGGFDTHAEQVDPTDTTIGTHAQLLKTLSDAIWAFQQDLTLLGLEDRVLGMTFSEFGRKIISNGGVGTDHGTAGAMMVFGKCVNQGVIGDNPVIASQVDSDEGVPMQYDFKWVYGSILMDWFDVEEDKVRNLLTQDFQYIPIVGGCDTGSTSAKEIVNILNTQAFPNPFDQTFNLKFALLKNEDVKIDLSNVEGRQVKVISSKKYSSGEHQVLIETHGLPAGVYFAKIQAGNGVKTLRVVKQ